MPTSSHTRKGKVRSRVNLKTDGVPSVKRSMAALIADRIKSGEIKYNTEVVKQLLKSGF